ncbi:hypothetical protein [Halobellus inordinatus]|uniref:hypothetical protein n=1 Tax=Halobellus inordinatus TaxID=1126236 RepID=UPI0021142D89|nr:hypothetical protein [Halobellus ramosii]
MSALGDVIEEAFKQLLRTLFGPIEGLIEKHANTLLETVVGTPHPDAVFSRPTNGVWPSLYDYYWESLIPLALLLWGLSIGLVIFFETTSHLFGSYHRSKLKKRAFSGLLGILLWWWMAALSLRLIEALTGFLVPDLSDISLFQTLSFSALGALGVAITMATDLVLFALIAILYFAREVILYLFVLLMPLLIALWIPGVGPLTLVSKFVKRLAGFYVPFLFMTVPVALLFRLGELLGENLDLTVEGITAWLAALIIPIVAIVSPFILFWQAGALFFTLDRASNQVSRHQAQRRAARTKAAGQTGVHHSKNFARGLRGDSAIQADGTRVFGAGGSRANRAGLRLRSRARDTGGRVREQIAPEQDGGTDTERFGALRSRLSRSTSQQRTGNSQTKSTGDNQSRGTQSPRDESQRDTER